VTRYEHTQIGHVIMWSVLAIIMIADSGLIGSSSQREAPVVVSIILLVCLVLFYKLTITVEGATLCVSLGIGIIRKSVPVVDIAACEPIRIKLLAQTILTSWLMQSGSTAAPTGEARLSSFAYRCQRLQRKDKAAQVRRRSSAFGCSRTSLFSQFAEPA
jgi:hypothetical protein